MVSTGVEWIPFLLPFFWRSCGAPCPLSSMWQGWLCSYLSSCAVEVAAGWHITTDCDMAGACERPVKDVICKGTAGIVVCPGRETEYFCGNLLEIDATIIQNSSVAWKHSSNQYVLVLIWTGKDPQRQKTTRLVKLMNFCNLWLKKISVCKPCPFSSPFQAFTCQHLM